jgi:hypothetical protein
LKWRVHYTFHQSLNGIIETKKDAYATAIAGLTGLESERGCDGDGLTNAEEKQRHQQESCRHGWRRTEGWRRGQDVQD